MPFLLAEILNFQGTEHLIGVGSLSYLNKDELNKYECIPYMTKDYPAAFLLGSEYRNDMNSMAEKLETVGAHYVLVDPFAENGITQPHCFVAAERVDPVAAEAFKKLTGFLKERILYKEH